MSDTLRTLSGHAALLEATANDPFVRWDVNPALLRTSWQVGSAFAFLRESHRHRARHLNVFGRAEDVTALLDALLPLDDVRGISVEQVLLPLVEPRFPLGPGGDWDWMWTKAAPACTPEEAMLQELDDSADAAEILRLNEIGSPTAESDPGTGRTELWLGIRDGGRIVAAGALHRTSGGAPHLAGIVVHPDYRGRRLGLALTAGLTREAIHRSGVATLGMYSSNATARRVYSHLGYRTARAWASRSFTSGSSTVAVNPCVR